MDVLNDIGFRCSVSSVLNKETKQYGKQFMFDETEDTAWSSDEGLPQWISLSFDEPQAISGFCFQFQGGFVGQDATVLLYSSEDNKLLGKEAFYPEDINSPQNFQLKHETSVEKCSKIKFVFASSTDLFGRIIVYKLKLLK
ncbi:nuclear receptor 2C2-associated protein [Scaptodrosophila lebanonensis]|uniref:Nuclear receptor 2C2-associated protein n=1 Tax=Drosophila lebanonensis TaxID=7225 RepID=A0A6J2U1E2_DROLE|nr:nuclear receptor 2C2-associated protein [Scaptodrosophila lebanonensis]